MNERAFYNSKRWQRLRAQILRRDLYQDKILLRYGKRRTADTVHHIFPREYFPEYEFEPWNLISLTNATHNTLHERDGHGLTEAGMDLLKRTARKNNIFLSEDTLRRINPPRG